MDSQEIIDLKIQVEALQAVLVALLSRVQTTDYHVVARLLATQPDARISQHGTALESGGRVRKYVDLIFEAAGKAAEAMRPPPQQSDEMDQH
ncbi:hypothetical protein G3N58_15220 [Paraburkholderia sp. Ac-20342]|uniref:hypothetical protein n=1 Tax=Paraburkholderia sp. Ac-20342 TaxID=2703889 RepID=UPI001981F792|nr:hypothetical protein [Paraburkholderia sp. Ac-20342]MBN3848171.1 hypothetical protein [Paraburkholderia sp. Ac-20342]